MSHEHKAASERERDRKQAVLDQIKELLEIHFDAAALVVAYQSEFGGTVTTYRGVGNWHAQNGLLEYQSRRRWHEAVMDAEEDAKRERESDQ